MLTFVYFVHTPYKISKPQGSPLLGSALDQCKIRECPSACMSAIPHPTCLYNVAGGPEIQKLVALSESGSTGRRSSHQHSQRHFRKRAGPGRQVPPVLSTVSKPTSTPRRCSCRLRSTGTRQLARSTSQTVSHGYAGNHFGDLQRGPYSKQAYPRVNIRASPPAAATVVALRYCSSSGFLRFRWDIYLTKISIHDCMLTDRLHTELTCDTADTTRHEPAEPADLTSILNVVPVRGQHLFLR